MLLEAIYLVLKSIYSFSIFSNEYKAWSICNPNKFIHKLIKQLPSSYWGIKSIVNKTFTKEDHSNLLVQIAQKISDPFFLNLLEKILYMDYLNSKSKYHSLSKVIEIPGSQLFYLLIDIAYSQLDCLIQSNILTLYIQKINCNQKDNRNISQIWQKRKYNQKLLFQKQNFKNILIYYVRYGYTIILLVKDPLKHSHMVDLNNFILNQIRQFNKVDQNIYNSQIFQPNKESLNLLSYKIFVNSKQVYIQIEAKKIIDLLIKYNFITYNKQNKIRPISQNKLLSYRDHQILESYQYIWSCFLEYYSGLSDYSYLQYIGILLKYSFFMTLSHKHKTTLSKIFSSYQKKEVNVFSFKSKSLKSKSLDFKEFNYVPDPFKYYY
uniref:putative reverse transcriptase/maturase n=1 Tax=Rhodaphanes brevistipitata TaxID=446136 RepID=UPI001FCDB184|nr:putative reverse transcriptase/maturase [Rhodaphanes brevistipitata]UNJ18467.1 putative reverse transcriptase/maturase [Rhodaphanes brevistipitata]